MGETRSTMRPVMSPVSRPTVSRRKRSSGNSGVRSSNRGRWRARSGSRSFTWSMRSSARVFSLRLVEGLLGIALVPLVDAPQGRVLFVAVGGAAGRGDVVALAQAELPHLLHRDVDVVLAREVALRAQEAVALVAQVEETGALDGLTR